MRPPQPSASHPSVGPELSHFTQRVAIEETTYSTTNEVLEVPPSQLRSRSQPPPNSLPFPRPLPLLHTLWPTRGSNEWYQLTCLTLTAFLTSLVCLSVHFVFLHLVGRTTYERLSDQVAMGGVRLPY